MENLKKEVDLPTELSEHLFFSYKLVRRDNMFKLKSLAFIAALISLGTYASHHGGGDHDHHAHHEGKHAHEGHHGHGHGHGHHKKNKKKIHVHGGIDLNYTWSFNERDELPLHNGEHDNFSAAQINTNFSGHHGKVDWLIDVNYDGQIVRTGHHEMLTQAYLAYHLSDDVTITAGRMLTNLGYEGSYNKDNWNYGKSWSYALTSPVYHEGAALRYTSEGGFGLGLFLYDGMDTFNGTYPRSSITTNNPTVGDRDKAYSAQLSYGHEMFGVVYNFYYDENAIEDYHNLNISADLSPAISVAASFVLSKVQSLIPCVNSAAASVGLPAGLNVLGEYFTTTIYAKFNTSKNVYIAPRFEIIKNDTSNNDLVSGTLTLGYNCKSLGKLRLEGRYDSADASSLLADSATFTKDNQFKLTTAWMYNF